MTLGQRIYQYRRAQGLSQEDLAESLNVSRQSVSKWETDGSIPDLDKLVALSELFGITLDQLVKGEALPAEPRELPLPTETEDLLSARRPDPYRRARTITGVILLSVSLALALLVILLTWDVLGALVLTSALWICGIVCLTIRRYTVLFFGWGAAVGLSAFLAPQSVFSFYNFNLITSVYSFFRFDHGPYVSGVSANPLSLVIHVICSLVVIALMVLTVIFVSREPIRVTAKWIRALCIVTAAYLLLDIAVQCLNMEAYMILDSADPRMNERLYILLSDVLGLLQNLRSCLRPIAFTAIATVIASFCRERMGKKNAA